MCFHLPPVSVIGDGKQSSLSTLVAGGTDYLTQPHTKAMSIFQISSFGELNVLES